MRVQNVTPFPHLVFQAQDARDREFWVLVLRGTFRIVPGRPLEPADEQHPIVKKDVFRGEPNFSSVVMESDVVAFKPKSDVLINAVAHAPGGRPASTWLVRARVGQVQKSLRVTGPRRWTKKRGSFQLEPPEQCTEVPIIYEHAFGGTFATGDRRDYCDQNPIGVGFVPAGKTPDGDEFPAPRIESPDQPIEELGKDYQPQGLGPMTRSWQPRLGKAGKFDNAWHEKRWPKLPEEFDFAFFNAAHPDLIYPRFLRGNEDVELENLTADGDLRFQLPGIAAAAFAVVGKGSPCAAPALLDTLLIDVPARRAHITWRATFPAEISIEQIVAGSGPITSKESK